MIKKVLFLPLVLIFASLLRFPSLFEPNWYGDEGIYQVIGQALREGRFLYAGIWDNKPPLLYIIYAIFDGDQFLVRLASLIVMLFTIIVFYLLTRRLFKNQNIVYITTSIFAFFFATPLLEGNIANAENFMLLPIIFAMYLIFSIKGYGDVKSYFLIGLLLSVAFLIKIVAIFDLGAVLLFLLISLLLVNLKKWFVGSFTMVIGFAIPICLTLIYFAVNGVLFDFFVATFSQNVTYIEAGNKLFIGQGLLITKLILLSVFCFFVFLKRKSLSFEYIFIYLWLGFSIFNALFGGRPWTHYLLTLLPSFCLFLGMFLENKKFRLVNAALFLLIVVIIAKNFWIYGKTLQYYGNFTGFIAGGRTVEEYLNFFDWFVVRDYEIASYIKQNSTKNDTIFIWGDNAQIYTLSKRLPPGRYTVSYHVTFYPNALLETKGAIEKEKPIFIIAIRNDFPSTLLTPAYQLKSELRGAKIYARRI